MTKVIIEHSGTIRFWGEWFARPLDNVHKVTDAVFDEDKNTLEISFGSGEKCLIVSPEQIESNNTGFAIKDANEIIFTWYYYGKPHTSNNLLKLQYFKKKNGTITSIKEDSYHHFTSSNFEPKENNAFEIL